MHVAYLLSSPGIPLLGASGSSVHVRSWVDAALELGHRVTLLVARVSARTGAPAEAHDARRSLPGQLRVYELDSPAVTQGSGSRSRREASDARRFATAALELLKSDPPALLYERYALFSDAGMRLREALGVPWILEVNAPLRLERALFEGLSDSWRTHRQEKRILRSADGVATVSTPLLDYLGEVVGVERSRLQRIPNGTRWRVSARSAPSAPTIGFVGSLKPWHGIETWLEVFSRVHARLPQVRGLVIGDGPGRTALLQRGARPGLESAIEWTGHLPQDELPERLKTLSVLLAPYPKLEPFYFCPLKVVEALAAGVPVVTTAQGDLPELIQSGGRCVAAGNGKALADATAALLESPSALQSAIDAALQSDRVIGWTDVVRQTFDLLERVSRVHPMGEHSTRSILRGRWR